MKARLTIPLALALAGLAAAGLFLFLGADSSTTVYVTNSGTKYHRDGCSALSRSKIVVTLEDAVRSGYESCGICRPPSPGGKPGGNGASSTRGEKAAARPGEAVPAALYRVHAAELKTAGSADIQRMLRAEVVDHVDGDTVRVRIANPPEGIGVVETIRMLGVDTPETVHPNKELEYFGAEASDFTKARLLNQNVYLAFDWDLRDRYGRLLAYIYTAHTANAASGTIAACFNAVLIREGYAHAYTRFAFQFADEFRALEQEARRERRGLWGK
jgi:micrococcal nuclease